MNSTCSAHLLTLVSRPVKLYFTRLKLTVPDTHYSGKAPALVQTKADSAGPLSNAGEAPYAALAAVQSFVAHLPPTLVADLQWGASIHSNFQNPPQPYNRMVSALPSFPALRI